MLSLTLRLNAAAGFASRSGQTETEDLLRAASKAISDLEQEIAKLKDDRDHWKRRATPSSWDNMTGPQHGDF